MRDPVNIQDLEWNEWNHGNKFGGKSKRISDAGGGQRIGVVLEELPPGRQSSPAHYHLSEEEHIWILQGQATLKIGEERRHVREGDYFCFLPGVEEPHCLVNEADVPCLYVVIGERRKDDVVIYPKSNKIFVRLLDRVYRNNPVEYWLDE
jgi:uncharacterized cupin superfamily protein